ncbi:MAG: hypothetical protein Q8K66_03510 [Sediminibacterium sp.]|nr:hypothetical protein [Sediminibacterium sp.]
MHLTATTTLELLKRICSPGPFENFALGGGTNLALRLGRTIIA